MFRQRGKALITASPKSQTKIKSITDRPLSHEALRPIVLSSLLVGYVPIRLKIPGILGGLFWFISLFVQAAFDFMSSRKTYGYAWAFIQILLFLNLAMCTYAARSKAIPWLETSLFQLDKEKKYLKTFARIRKLFRMIPWVVVIFSLVATGLQFFCFHYDDAFSVSFEQQVSSEWRIVLLVVWFLTNVHMLYAFAFFWCIAMCNMYTTGYSMTEYHEIMTSHLKNKETPVTFRQAVHSFAERSKFLQKSASACRISLAFLLVYSIASLAVNAFYYLYKSRKAAYIFFALMPPICSVYPLCLAAWVTKQYKWYLAVVVKAWAERPESSDDDEESGSDTRPNKEKHKSFARKLTKRVKSAGKKDEYRDGKPRRRSLFFQTRPKSDFSHSETEDYPKGKNDNQSRRRSMFLLPTRPKSAGDGKPRRSSLFVRTSRPKSSVNDAYSDTEDYPEAKSKINDSNDNIDKITQNNSLNKSALRATRSNPLPNGSHSDSECYPEAKKVNFAEFPPNRNSASSEKTTLTFVSDTEDGSDEPRPVRSNDEHQSTCRSKFNDKDQNIKLMNHEEKTNVSEVNVPATINNLKPIPDIRQPMSDDEGATDDEPKPNDEKGEKPAVSRQRVMELILRGTARAVGRLQHRVKMPKFNFEKYISYLQNVLPTVGFRIMGITVTWEMVSTILFLEVSLLALFMQESIFGNQKANFSL